MSMFAAILVWSACAATQAAVPDLKTDEFTLDSEPKLPLSLADELAQDKPIDKAPVEKTPRQDDFGRDVPARRDDDDLLVNFGAKVRFSVPFGAADRSYYNYYGYYYVDHYYSWADFFNPGWGIELEADIFFGKNGPGNRRSPGFNYGLALLLQVDEYYGRNIGGDFGNSLTLDDMSATALLVGGRVLQTINKDFYYGGVIALGAIHYTAVEGTFQGPLFPPITGLRDKILKDTYTFASSFAANGGYRLGPLGLSMSAALRINAPPNEGSHFSMNSGAFWTFDLSLGAELGF